MQVVRPVGREAAAKKYDALSALMAHALSGDPQRQRLVLRFMALITTRYNWQRNELVMGQREIARLWCVDERTVKRDMARLRAAGWVEVRRQGARGRVAVLAFAWARIMEDTRPAWGNIGPDFVERVGGPGDGGADGPQAVPGGVPGGATVVPFRRPSGPGWGPGAADDGAAPGGSGDAGAAGGAWDDGGPQDALAPGGADADRIAAAVWRLAALRLAAEDRALFSAWFAGLAEIGVEAGCLSLIAPSRFQATYITTHLIGRLQRAVEAVDPSIRAVCVRGG